MSVSDVKSSISSSKYCITTGSSCTPSTSATLSSNVYTVTLGTNASAQKVCFNTYGTHNISHLFVSSDQTFFSYYAPATSLKSYFVANGQTSSDVTFFQTLTLDLNTVKNSAYYVGVHNCDSEFYVQKFDLQITLNL